MGVQLGLAARIRDRGFAGLIERLGGIGMQKRHVADVGHAGVDHAIENV